MEDVLRDAVVLRRNSLDSIRALFTQFSFVSSIVFFFISEVVDAPARR